MDKRFTFFLCFMGILLIGQEYSVGCADYTHCTMVDGNNDMIGGNVMKASVDKSGCIACGLCTNTCPGVFSMGDDGLAEAITDDIPADEEAAAEMARDGCPVSVIDLD